MLRKIFNKSNAEKPKSDAPDNSDTDTEITEAANEKIVEEVTEAESESVINEPSESTENVEPDETTEEPDETTDLPDDELVALSKELSGLQDKYLRLAAEFDNYRKRTIREKAELIQNAGESLLRDILPLVDDFERGLELASNADDMNAIKTGMGLIYNKLKDFLTNHGVKEIDARDEPFDTDWHEAVTNIPAPSDEMKGIVLDVIQKGYTLNDKVMRYSKVVVGE